MDAQRAMLDALMGKNRNRTTDDAPIREQHWDDNNVCPYFICDFCPNDLFINTKSDLGPCQFQHLNELKREYRQETRRVQRRVEKRLLRYLYDLISECDRRIRRGKERIALNAISTQPNPQLQQQIELQQRNINLRCEQLDAEMNKLKEHIETLIETGDAQKLDDAASIFKQIEHLESEKLKLQTQIENIKSAIADANTHISNSNNSNNNSKSNTKDKIELPSPNSSNSNKSDTKIEHVSTNANTAVIGYLLNGMKKGRLNEKNRFEVCEICGVFQAIDDAHDRIIRHFEGKQHRGYDTIREAIQKYEQLHKEEDIQKEKERKESFNSHQEHGHGNAVNVHRDRDRDRNRNGNQDRNRRRSSRSRNSHSQSQSNSNTRSSRHYRERDRNTNGDRYRDRDQDRDRYEYRSSSGRNKRRGRDHRSSKSKSKSRSHDRDRDRHSKRGRDDKQKRRSRSRSNS